MQLWLGFVAKQRFLPARYRHRTLVKYVRPKRDGTVHRPSEKLQHHDDTMLRLELWAGCCWKKQDEISNSVRARNIIRIKVPKAPLPKNGESYNALQEYLPSNEKRQLWANSAPEDRARNYLPTNSDCLSHVP